MYELENARQLVTGFAKRNASVPQLKVSYYNHKFLKKIENKISLIVVILIFVFIFFDNWCRAYCLFVARLPIAMLVHE